MEQSTKRAFELDFVVDSSILGCFSMDLCKQKNHVGNLKFVFLFFLILVEKTSNLSCQRQFYLLFEYGGYLEISVVR